MSDFEVTDPVLLGDLEIAFGATMNSHYRYYVKSIFSLARKGLSAAPEALRIDDAIKVLEDQDALLSIGDDRNIGMAAAIHILYNHRNELRKAAMQAAVSPLARRAFGPAPTVIPDGYTMVETKSFQTIMRLLTKEQMRELCMLEGERFYLNREVK